MFLGLRFGCFGLCFVVIFVWVVCVCWFLFGWVVGCFVVFCCMLLVLCFGGVVVLGFDWMICRF